ncbi:Pmr5/Cas1p GDSL/SGNH-like acyl-esterase family protein [Medicago truncatula]|uniref:Pmr5/Cas1p GDSL/SGNH-like acyl-esterase family protein n=1 Tax=Medicago truncatula TaxID=3880 RepID=A0A072TX44_MEDTR|nr:Pmr5/Cas1p GDSL/SGNH-like acyl-esterase family protein [Medicago truncatula]
MIQASKSQYYDADIIISNTGHLWNYEKTKNGRNYFQEGNHVEVSKALQPALNTWAKWVHSTVDSTRTRVDSTVDSTRTRVFFTGFSASHYKGGQWNSGGSFPVDPKILRNQLSTKVLPGNLNNWENPQETGFLRKFGRNLQDILQEERIFLVVYPRAVLRATRTGYRSGSRLSVPTKMHKQHMLCLMFQHRASNKHKRNKIKEKKVKGTASLLTQFRDKHTYSGGYQARKEIH